MHQYDEESFVVSIDGHSNDVDVLLLLYGCGDEHLTGLVASQDYPLCP